MTRILIADDNTQNLYLLESLLKSYQFEVMSAANGAVALEEARNNPPDLVVTDILMPVMDGFELCRQWKRDELLARIPFMFYTATYTDFRDEQYAMSLGADRFVIKPQKPEILGQIICEVLTDNARGSHAGAPAMGEIERLQQYTDVLSRKLEKKVDQLETETAGLSRAEEALRHSETRYRTLYKSMMDAFVSIDMTGTILEYNESFRNMLGYPDEELRRLTNASVTPERWHRFEQYIIDSQVMVRGYSDVFEKEYCKKDGTVVPVELRISLIRDDTNKPERMWGIVRDISERRKSEDKIRLTGRKLTLMNDVTYQDIQNKITGLRGYVELSKKLEHDPDILAFIEKEQALLKSIHDVIQHTKDYQQMGEVQPRWILLEKTIRMQYARISQKNEVVLESDLGGLEIYADPLVEQIFYNLLHNAIRHGERCTRISFGYRETSDGVVVTCEDDGIGIPAEQKAQIFDRVVGGEGRFGLFFVREFLSLSGMTIRETGTPGQGARFEITVPRMAYRFINVK